MTLTDRTAFSNPTQPISTSGMLRYAVSVEDFLNGLLGGDQAFARQRFAAPVEMTINGSGALAAPTQVQITVAANSGTADDLDTITAVNNTFVVLRAKTGHTIMIRPGFGNISSPSGAGMVLTGYRMALLHCQNNAWALVNAPSPKVVYSTSDPTTGDDALDGYWQGSLWVNTSLDRVWTCVDATVGAAIWRWISPPKNGFMGRSDDGSTDDFFVDIGGSRANSAGVFNDSGNTFTKNTTGASPGSVVSTNLGSSLIPAVRPAYSPIIEFILKTGSDITLQRQWWGIGSTPFISNNDTLANKFIGFRYSTAAGDTGWRPVLNDGSTQNTGTAIGTVLADTVYKLRFRIDDAAAIVYFSVNDSAEQSLNTNYPAASTDMIAIFGLYTLDSAARSILVSRMEVRW